MCPDHQYKFRLKYPATITLLITLPLMLSIILSAVLLSSLLLRDLDSQANSFGQTSADLLAVSCQDYLLTGDLLSLNVLLSDLISKGYFNHAAIYAADNRLLVEVGNAVRTGNSVYTAEIHYQDSIAGHLRLTLEGTQRRKKTAATIAIIMISNLLLFALVALLVYRSGDRIATFLIGRSAAMAGASVQLDRQDTDSADSEILNPHQESDSGCRFSILVIKLKPIRVALQLKQPINQAISLYNGEIIHQTDDEVIVTFTGNSDHCFQAICTLLVIQSLAVDFVPGLKVGAGIHCGTDFNEQDSIKKHAIYLASLGSGNLLTSEKVFFEGQIQNRVKISEFHSGLAPESKVYAIESLQDDYQTLINKQAAQLNKNR